MSFGMWQRKSWWWNNRMNCNIKRAGISFFEFMALISIYVNNLMDQLLVNESVAIESTTLNMSNFSSGIYFVNFMKETDRDIQSFKIVKQ